MYINDLPDRVKSLVRLFADDTVIHMISEVISEVISEIVSEIISELWLLKIGKPFGVQGLICSNASIRMPARE